MKKLLLGFLYLNLCLISHELGHLFMALLWGLPVSKLSLGFGPEILGITFQGIRWSLACIPLGAFVQLPGDVPGLVPNTMVSLAGPMVNFYTAFFLLLWPSFWWTVGMHRLLSKTLNQYKSTLEIGDLTVSAKSPLSEWRKVFHLHLGMRFHNWKGAPKEALSDYPLVADVQIASKNIALYALGLGIFNLLPIAPLDGGRLFYPLLPNAQITGFATWGAAFILALILSSIWAKPILKLIRRIRQRL